MFVVFPDQGSVAGIQNGKSTGNQNKMSAYIGTKLIVTHKRIPHHMPYKTGTFSH